MSKASEEKEKGNQFFKTKNFEDALTCYSKAIELDPKNHVLYGNRSQTLLNLKRPKEAIEDCNYALDLEPNFVKGYLRRGAALKILGDFEKAMDDFKKVLQLEPTNKQALQELKMLDESLSNKKIKLIESISPSEHFDSIDERTPMVTSKNRTKMRSIPMQIPVSTREITRIPVNDFEFYCDWRELSDDSSKLKYIINIGSVKLGKMFKSLMEPLVFCDIIKILPNCVDIPFRSRLLYELSKMERFGTLILFLEEHEEKILKTLIVDMKVYLDSSEIQSFMQKVGPKFA